MASRFALLFTLFAGVVACGGPSEEKPPVPLDKHFDDMYIAQVPLDQKQDVIKTQNDWSIAKMEAAKAEADYNDSTANLEVAKNDAKQAHTTLDSAITMKNSAAKSGDMNRTNQATKDERIAEDQAKAADQHAAFFDRYREFLRIDWRHKQAVMYWREAQYEAAKSGVAQRTGKAIANVNYTWFPSQEQDRSKHAEYWRGHADAARHDASNARDKWIDLQKTADTESGHMQNYSVPDPMASPGQPAQASGQ
jgi:hypothetical protein